MAEVLVSGSGAARLPLARPPSPLLVAAAKTGYLQSRQVNRSQDMTLAQSLGSGLYLDRTLAFDAELERRIDALTPEEIVAAMRRHLDLGRMSIIKAGEFAEHDN